MVTATLEARTSRPPAHETVRDDQESGKTDLLLVDDYFLLAI